ncbi:MAG: hypothetical protein RI930_377 [Pseudomonadota bacterium]|jgi:hypothetical protein
MNYTLQKFKKQPPKIKKIIKNPDFIGGFTTIGCIFKTNHSTIEFLIDLLGFLEYKIFKLSELLPQARKALITRSSHHNCETMNEL